MTNEPSARRHKNMIHASLLTCVVLSCWLEGASLKDLSFLALSLACEVC